MPSASAPFGLRPVRGTFGNQVNPIALPGSLTSGVTANISKGGPVKILTTGLLSAAAAGDRVFGVFAGCEYDDGSSGKRVISPSWTASASATNAIAYVWPAENTDFEIQSTVVSGGAVITALTGGCDTSTNNDAAHPTTGTRNSTLTLDYSTLTTTGQFTIMGLAPFPDNDFTSDNTYPIFRVRATEPQIGITQVGVNLA